MHRTPNSKEKTLADEMESLLDKNSKLCSELHQTKAELEEVKARVTFAQEEANSYREQSARDLVLGN